MEEAIYFLVGALRAINASQSPLSDAAYGIIRDFLVQLIFAWRESL